MTIAPALLNCRNIPAQLEALIFDVDGTLYDQRMLRRMMLRRLISSYAFRPVEGWRIARVLSAYRRGQERLRHRAETGCDLATRQLQFAAESVGADPATVAPVIHRWMEREPLPLLRGCMPSELERVLEIARQHRIKLAVLSDYPAHDKVAALGLAEFFDLIVSAQDPEVRAFKPEPRGLEVVLRRLGVDKGKALYIGDRPDVDALTAKRAGIPCAILGNKTRLNPGGWLEVADYRTLQSVVFNG